MPEPALKAARLALRTAVGVVIVFELVLAVGVLLQGLDANPDASFTDFAYRNHERVLRPFDGMFDDASLGEDTEGVIDVSAVFAMAAYATLFVPLGLMLSAVGRRLDDLELGRQKAVDDARHARLFSSAPPPEPDEAPTTTLKDRIRGWFSRSA